MKEGTEFTVILHRRPNRQLDGTSIRSGRVAVFIEPVLHGGE